MKDSYKHTELTDKIIKAYYKVYNTLGYGFLEKVYENAMYIELKKMGFFVQKQKNISVFYESEEVGDYYADLIVDEKVIIELKAAEGLCEEHECQLINYLKATEIEVGLLLNFGKQPELRRKIFSNKNKQGY
jgi:GxxExxY protein